MLGYCSFRSKQISKPSEQDPQNEFARQNPHRVHYEFLVIWVRLAEQYEGARVTQNIPKRERARRETRRRFEQWARNPECHSNVVSAVHNVKMGVAARKENPNIPREGQSVFALLRGRTFEAQLIKEDAAVLLESLQRSDVIAPTSTDFADHRIKLNDGPLAGLDEAIETGTKFLVDLAAGRSFNGAISSFTVRIPKGIMLPEAILIIDVLSVETHLDIPTISVGEIKTYADQGGHTSRSDLATARAQMGLYAHALEVTLASLGLSEKISVSHFGFLVLTYPGSNRPSVRGKEDLRYQRERSKRGFDLMEEAAHLMNGEYGAGDEADEDEASLLDLVLNAATSFQDSCIAFCERADTCFQRALEENKGVALGDDVERFLNGIPLNHAENLLKGSKPNSVAEHDLLARLNDPLPELP